MSSEPVPIPEWAEPRRVPPEELARRQGVRLGSNLSDLAGLEFFDSDEELDEFLTWVYAERRRGFE